MSENVVGKDGQSWSFCCCLCARPSGLTADTSPDRQELWCGSFRGSLRCLRLFSECLGASPASVPIHSCSRAWEVAGRDSKAWVLATLAGDLDGGPECWLLSGPAVASIGFIHCLPSFLPPYFPIELVSL